MFIFSSISSCVEFWSVSYTSVYENSESKVLKIYFLGEMSTNWPHDLLEINVYEIVESYWQSLLTILQWTNTTSAILNEGHFHHFYL